MPRSNHSNRQADLHRVDFVVVAYRSARDIRACLDSIEHDRPKGSQIIVVDNASPDDSATLAGEHASRPTVLRAPTNLGFGKACNLAAESSSAQLLFFVNPDARLQPGSTKRLAGDLLEDDSLAAAGPKILNSAGALRAASAGFEPSVRSALGHFLLLGRVPFVARLFPPLQLRPEAPRQLVDWISGAAMMVRAADFERVSGFDPSIFMYMEDVDLCRRLRDRGRSILYDPAAVVEHSVGGSQGSEQATRWYRAFHEYVSRRRGGGYARLVSAFAASGLAIRAVIYGVSRRGPATRMAIAAVAAARATIEKRAPAG